MRKATTVPHELPAAITADGVTLHGTLALPVRPVGVVLFAHGSGSGRFSPRNNYVAGVLRQAGVGTLLFDLLTEVEAADREKVFDIPLLAERLLHGTNWIESQPEVTGLPVGYFGASTGAAAALVAAAQDGRAVRAIVSRGGRPDLAGDFLSRVRAPTLLIVGGDDEPVIQMNRSALSRLVGVKELVIVPGATHLFEEPGTLEEVARLASEWFVRHLGGAKTD